MGASISAETSIGGGTGEKGAVSAIAEQQTANHRMRPTENRCNKWTPAFRPKHLPTNMERRPFGVSELDVCLKPEAALESIHNRDRRAAIGGHQVVADDLQTIRVFLCKYAFMKIGNVLNRMDFFSIG